jgi:hypothetical protein
MEMGAMFVPEGREGRGSGPGYQQSICGSMTGPCSPLSRCTTFITAPQVIKNAHNTLNTQTAWDGSALWYLRGEV